MGYKEIILSILMGATMVLSSLAYGQTSRQVSDIPVFLVRGETARISAPLLATDRIMNEVIEILAPGQEGLSFYEKMALLEQADPYFLLETAAEKYVLYMYNRAVENGETGRIIATLAYMTGLASPLHPVAVTLHNRLPQIFGRDDLKAETYTITYSLHRGYIKYCEATILKSRATGELLDVNFLGCEHYIDGRDF